MPEERTLGSLLRHLTELLDNDVEAAYRDAGIAYRPRFTPVVRALMARGPSNIRSIANAAGISHSAVSQTVGEMVKQGLARAVPGEDGRERIIHLTDAGEALLPKIRQQWAATNAAARSLGDELGVDLEALLRQAISAVEARPFLERIREADSSRVRKPKT